MINHVLRECWSFARSYLDNIIVHDRSWEEHLIHLLEVLNSLQVAQLTFNVSKFQFGQHEVRYLRHIIGEGIVKPDPQKLDAVKNYPQPDSKKYFRAFLGLVGYCRKFVRHFSVWLNL